MSQNYDIFFLFEEKASNFHMGIELHTNTNISKLYFKKEVQNK